jgi:hypothetical protein
MNTLELNVQELSFPDLSQIDGGLHWGWYAGAFGLGLGLGVATVMMA